MNRLLLLAAIVVGLVNSRSASAQTDSLESTAMTLFNSLDASQKTRAALAFDAPERNQELFPGGPRAGIPIRELKDDQQKLAIAMLTAFTSDYGKKKCEAVANQEPGGLSRYYVAFFGEPGPGKSYAWRIAEHHLTLVNVEVEKGKMQVFGPILLGANPPTLWNDEEDKMMELFALLSPDEKKQVVKDGKADSAKPIGDAGVVVKTLSDEVRLKVRELFEQRLKFFSPEIQKRIEAMVEKQGGLDEMKIVFFGQATKRCSDGGKWDFKLGGANFLCDYENSRGHIHLAMKGRLDSASQ